MTLLHLCMYCGPRHRVFKSSVDGVWREIQGDLGRQVVDLVDQGGYVACDRICPTCLLNEKARLKREEKQARWLRETELKKEKEKEKENEP